MGGSEGRALCAEQRGRRGEAVGPPCRLLALSVGAAEEKLTVLQTAFGALKSIVAGGVAGMIAKSVVAPVDRIKILFQVSSEPFSLGKVRKIIGRILREEGIAGLWKGNSATMLRVFPYAGIQFMTFDAVKLNILRLKGTPSGQLSNLESLCAGSFAGFVSCTVTYPLDMARAVLAVEPGERGRASHNVLYIFRSAYSEGGIPRLYRGIIPTLLGILPYAGIAFTINDKANHQIQAMWGEEPTTVQKLGCGAFAGLIAQSATYPLDVVRRRMQTAGLVSGGSIEKTLYGQQKGQGEGGRLSMVGTLTHVYRTEGYRGLFKGLSMNWIKGPIALSISFTTFDFLKQLLHIRPDARH